MYLDLFFHFYEYFTQSKKHIFRLIQHNNNYCNILIAVIIKQNTAKEK